MTISNQENAFVWIYLENKPEPVVAGRITKVDSRYYFTYGRSYLEREDAIAISALELPLQKGTQQPDETLWMHGCLRDGAPDAWGRRVILNRHFGTNDPSVEQEGMFNEIDFMLNSGSDRIGALDFQLSPTEYVPRQSRTASLDELMDAAFRVENNLSLSPELDRALLHGTSLGGARPKVNIKNGRNSYLAKLSSTTDTWNVVKSEYVAMKLAAMVGINCAEVELTTSLGKDVLLVRRFDRHWVSDHECRKGLVSALSLLKLDEMHARYASYEDFAEVIRLHFRDQENDRLELFKRLVFNILIGNTDDHARNHAAIWDGVHLRLSPAYDICPHPRTGQEASQAMFIQGSNNSSQIKTCLAAADYFGLTREAAVQEYEFQRSVIESQWESVCDEADLSRTDRNLLWGRSVLNPYCFYNV